MKQNDDLTIKEMLKIMAEYQAFCFHFKKSFLKDPAFKEVIENVLSEDADEDFIEEYEVLMESFDSVLSVEDQLLDTEWLVQEIRENLE